MQSPTPAETINTLYVLGVVYTILQSIIAALAVWLIKTTRSNERAIDRMSQTLFGDKEHGSVGVLGEIRERIGRMEHELEITHPVRKGRDD